MLNGSFKIVPNRLVGTKRELSSHLSFLPSLQPGVVVVLSLASLWEWNMPRLFFHLSPCWKTSAKNNFLGCLWEKILSNASELIRVMACWHHDFWCTYFYKYAIEVHLSDIVKWYCHSACLQLPQLSESYLRMWWTKEIKTPARLLHIFLIASDLFTINGCLKLAKF